jgi:hypothetical protein
MSNMGRSIFERQILQTAADKEAARLREVEDRNYNLRVQELALRTANSAQESERNQFWRQMQMAQLMGKAASVNPSYSPQAKDPALQEGIDVGRGLGEYEMAKIGAQNAWRDPWQDSINSREGLNRTSRDKNAWQGHLDKVLGFDRADDRAALQANVTMRGQDMSLEGRKYAADRMAGSFNYGRVPAEVQIAMQLGNRFHQTSTAKDAHIVAEASAKILGAPDDGPGDLSLVTGFMKMIDPTTGVRDNEFANALRAGGWLDLAKASLDQAMSGKRISADVRAKFQNATRQIMRAHDERYKAVLKPYEEQFDRMNLDKGLLTSDLNLDFMGEEEAGGSRFER